MKDCDLVSINGPHNQWKLVIWYLSMDHIISESWWTWKWKWTMKVDNESNLENANECGGIDRSIDGSCKWTLNISTLKIEPIVNVIVNVIRFKWLIVNTNMKWNQQKWTCKNENEHVNMKWTCKYEWMHEVISGLF